MMDFTKVNNCFLMVSLPVLIVACTTSLAYGQGNSEQARAIAKIERWGGKVTLDANSPDKPATAVVWNYGYVINEKMVILKELSNLQSLELNYSNVTDAGLANLKGLSRLRCLSIDGSKITDAGLANLKGLSKLESLSIQEQPITDAGLEHLMALGQLRCLNLNNTNVTDAGLSESPPAKPEASYGNRSKR